MNATCCLQTILLILMLPMIGCQTGNPEGDPSSQSWIPNWDVRKAIGWQKKQPDPPAIPDRVVSTWTDTVLHRTGQKSMRGFGGRLVFFSRDGDEPISVQGQLVVYSFDETNRASHDTAPTKKFVFPAEQFVRHESTSKLGPSYSVWLPWDEVGGPQKNVSLIVRFEPVQGSLVVGGQTHHLLPGLMLANQSPGNGSSDNRQPSDYLKEAHQLIQPRQNAPRQNALTSNPIQLTSAALPTEKASSSEQDHKVLTRSEKMNTTTIRLPAKRTARIGTRGQRSEVRGQRSESRE
jgi:hypothetical protein